MSDSFSLKIEITSIENIKMPQNNNKNMDDLEDILHEKEDNLYLEFSLINKPSSILGEYKSILRSFTVKLYREQNGKNSFLYENDDDNQFMDNYYPSIQCINFNKILMEEGSLILLVTLFKKIETIDYNNNKNKDNNENINNPPSKVQYTRDVICSKDSTILSKKLNKFKKIYKENYLEMNLEKFKIQFQFSFIFAKSFRNLFDFSGNPREKTINIVSEGIQDKNNVYSQKMKEQNLILYENIVLYKEKIEEVQQNNLISAFLISGIGNNIEEIDDSENFISSCGHQECYIGEKSFKSKVIYSLINNNKINDKLEITDDTSKLIFPNGIKICKNYNEKFYLNSVEQPLSYKNVNTKNFSYNIMTDIKGNKHYIYSLIFYVKFNIDDLTVFYPKFQCNKNIYSKISLMKKLYIPYAFSVITRINCFVPFHNLLYDLFLNFKNSKGDTEEFDNELVHLLYEIPFPPANTEFHIFLPSFKLCLFSPIYSNKPIYPHIFQLPNPSIPSINACFISSVFLLFLLEKQLLFISSSKNKLFLTLEAFIYILYPLRWVSVYVPIIGKEELKLILQSFLPFAVGYIKENNMKNLNIGENSNDRFLIDLDNQTIENKENLSKIIDNNFLYNNLVEKLNKYNQNSNNSNEFTYEKFYYIFKNEMYSILSDYEKFTSFVGNKNLFNQQIFLKNKNKKYNQFFTDFTNTQMFNTFIQDIDSPEEALFYKEFKQNIKSTKNFPKETQENTNMYLFPYFFSADKYTYENFHVSITNHYKLKNKPHYLNFVVNTDFVLKFKIIMRNYIPKNLKKYLLNQINIFEIPIDDNEYNNNNNINNNNNDNNEINIKINKTKRSKTKDSFDIKQIGIQEKNPLSTRSPLSGFENSFESALPGFAEFRRKRKSPTSAKYRRQASLLGLARKENIEEAEKYEGQILEIVDDFMSYVLVNNNVIGNNTLDDISYYFLFNFVKKEFAYILFQEKFLDNIQHELTYDNFILLFKIIYYILINSSDSESDFEYLSLITESLFFYFYTETFSKNKVFLYHQISAHGTTFPAWEKPSFWAFFFDKRRGNGIEDKIFEYMNELGINNFIINYCLREKFGKK